MSYSYPSVQLQQSITFVRKDQRNPLLLLLLLLLPQRTALELEWQPSMPISQQQVVSQYVAQRPLTHGQYNVRSKNVYESQ
jgi:hypothetical protein